MDKAQRGRGWSFATGPVTGIVAGAGYGMIARLVFGFPTVLRGGHSAEAVFGVMTISFLFLVPVAVGAVAVVALPWELRVQAWTWLVLPSAACVALLLGVAVTLLEGAICIVMAAPVFFGFAMVGGVVAGLVLKHEEPRVKALTALALVPFLGSPLELRAVPRAMQREVITERLVRASPEVLWREVIRVPEIREGELRGSFFTAIGIPRPLEARLDRDGVGALRTASFRGGITFREHIAVWRQNERLGFSISVVPESILPGLLDEHVRVGSEHFDVTWGEFRLVPAGPQRTRLVLLSRHRLSTRFNAYAGLWTDAVMRDLQERICEVVARRAEAAAIGQ